MTATPERETTPLAEPGTICPYLLVAAGHWRNAEPSREHVCAAEAEPIPIGLETQRRLCFGDHTVCRRYEGAVAAYRAAVPLVPLRPVARTVPVVVDRGRPPLPLPHVGDRRLLGQAVLALAMIAAVVALLLARLGPTAGGAAQASGSPSLGASAGVASPSASPSLPPSASPSPAPTPTPTASPKATRKPSPSPGGGSGQTYTVKPGDTLSSIALKFGTTVKALSKLNGITDPSLIRSGQVLKIP